jgi:hypothetical protein
VCDLAVLPEGFSVIPCHNDERRREPRSQPGQQPPDLDVCSRDLVVVPKTRRQRASVGPAAGIRLVWGVRLEEVHPQEAPAIADAIQPAKRLVDDRPP